MSETEETQSICQWNGLDILLHLSFNSGNVDHLTGAIIMQDSALAIAQSVTELMDKKSQEKQRPYHGRKLQASA